MASPFFSHADNNLPTSHTSARAVEIVISHESGLPPTDWKLYDVLTGKQILAASITFDTVKYGDQEMRGMVEYVSDDEPVVENPPTFYSARYYRLGVFFGSFRFRREKENEVHNAV